MQGVFVTLEGVDGSGKTTQTALLVRALEEAGREVVRLREPGGTQISEQIRHILLDPTNSEMCDECELLLYEASRAQLVRQVIEPALAAGKVVVCDRYYDSTYAYQAGGRGLDDDLVRRANVLGSCGRVPDATVVFDIEPRVRLRHRAARGLGPGDRERRRPAGSRRPLLPGEGACRLPAAGRGGARARARGRR